jgi:small-conductance mechanosensitive channel
MNFFGVRLIGLTAENLQKLILTLALVALVAVVRYAVGRLAAVAFRRARPDHARFWTWQLISIGSAAVLVLGLVSIWIDQPGRLTTAVGLMTAGLAFALQRVVTSIAGYVVILRGRNFTIGDRIVMGGVRGRVIALGFMQTTIMEMGQAPGEEGDDPSIWVKSRQYTGRIVTVTNDRIFEQPVYNYTREFPFLWEEIAIPIAYKDDWRRAEDIVRGVADRHTRHIAERSRAALHDMARRYFEVDAETTPAVYVRLTDNWVELTVRFIAEAHDIRQLKDRMSRDILTRFEQARIGIASATFEVVGLPTLRLAGATGR